MKTTKASYHLFLRIAKARNKQTNTLWGNLYDDARRDSSGPPPALQQHCGSLHFTFGSGCKQTNIGQHSEKPICCVADEQIQQCGQIECMLALSEIWPFTRILFRLFSLHGIELIRERECH